MLQAVKNLLSEFPLSKHLLKFFLQKWFNISYDLYPRPQKNELKQFKKVLFSGKWNSGGASDGMHYELEKEFSNYIGCEHAIAVNTGGMAIQMILRALGLKPGDEIIHQVDTCVATSYAIMNACCTPIFSDIDLNTFMLDKNDIEKKISRKTRVIMPVHIWGNSENMDMISKVASDNNLIIVEDACLSLGALWKERKVGSFGKAASFSFGCLKPVQAGEGGMIVTHDSHLAKELRILRDWGETTKELGYRDQKQLSWNGRMSEFVAAVALEQLRGYQKHLNTVRENVTMFSDYIQKIYGLTLMHSPDKSAYTQIVVKIDKEKFVLSKKEFMKRLKEKNISVWHANFEPITSLSFFSKKQWKDWILKGDIEFVEKNYSSTYPNSINVYENIGIGINKIHFLHKKNVKILIQVMDSVLSNLKI